MNSVRTDLLEITYEQTGPNEGPPLLLLLHGWPDAPRGWRRVADGRCGWAKAALEMKRQRSKRIPNEALREQRQQGWQGCLDGLAEHYKCQVSVANVSEGTSR